MAEPATDPLHLPDPDAIRAAIDAADERSRLLRRLLRLSLRWRVHLTTGDRLPAPAADGKGALVPDVLPLPGSVPADPPDLEAARPRKRRRPRPLAVGARQLARLLTVGLRTVRTWDAAGKLPAPVRIGGRVVWRVSEIRKWLDAGAPDRETWSAIRKART